MIWQHQIVDEDAARRLSRAVGVSLPLARILIGRGFGESETARRFLKPHPSHLRDPWLMADMKQAIKRPGQPQRMVF